MEQQIMKNVIRQVRPPRSFAVSSSLVALGIAFLVGCSSGGSGSPDNGGDGGGNPSAGSTGTAGGAAGAPGAAGSSGVAGATGAAGATGIAGASGVAGAPGGAPGVAGATGEAGATGVAGAPASAGAGGSSSQAGSSGSAGSAGPAGAGGSAKGGQGGVGGSAKGGQGGVGGSAKGGQGGSATPTGGSGGSGPIVIKRYIGNIAAKNKDIDANFSTMWQQVTLEANSKWGFVQPDSATQWIWEPVDKVYQYALDHNIVFKEHTFFWNYEQPGWVNDSNIATVGPAWIKAFCERYPKTAMIDVANEPYNHPAPYRNGMGGAGKSGFDWVVQAHKWARQYCPNAILILNEYNAIEYEEHYNNYTNMLQALLTAGAPVDAIGVQGHDVSRVGVATAKMYLDKMVARFNLPVYVTEFDIDISDDAQQKQVMQDAITMFWNQPMVKGITYWGYQEGLTWRVNGWLVHSNGSYRPAMTWLQDFIKSH
jgi:endo-1,4-beta-xylanase